LGIANRAKKQMHAMLAEFGMTPSARARVAAGDPPMTDPFDDLLRG
jgi:phage terminase small subunit